MIPDQAIVAGLAAWGQYPVGASPKQQMINILEAAAPYMLSLSAAEIEAVADMIKAAKADGWDECERAEYVITLNADGSAWEAVKTNPYRSQA